MTPHISLQVVARTMSAAGLLAIAAIAGCSGATPNLGSTEGGGSAVADGSPAKSAEEASSPGDDASSDAQPDGYSGTDSASDVDDSTTPDDAAALQDAREQDAKEDDAGEEAAREADAHEAGLADVTSEAEAAAADAGEDVSCVVQMTPLTLGGTALSSGFSGTAAAYDALSGLPCVTAADCVSPCVAAGGTMASCASGSACLMGAGLLGGMGCSPPSYWLSPNLALSALDDTSSAATLMIEATSYFDALVVTDFGLEVPDGAIVRGIRFDVQRATACGDGEDKAIQVLQNGVPVGTNHRQVADLWPAALTTTSYGGPDDTWGVSWIAADIRATGFGISITPEYTMTVGNDSAYVDSVRVTVFYAQCN
jgi:hypothetical protein